MKENKKSFKEVVKENKGKIITGVACTTTLVITGLLIKEKIDAKVLKESYNELAEVASSKLNLLNSKVEVIHEAMSEGMLQEAIATTTRKFNNRMDILDRLKGNENDEKYIKAMDESLVFIRRLNAFHKLEEIYYIED